MSLRNLLCGRAHHPSTSRSLHIRQTNGNPCSPVPADLPPSPVQNDATTLREPKVKQYANSVFLYTDPSTPETCHPTHPLLLFLPWMGAKPQSYKKYMALYFHLGLDVLVVESSMSHFLWPRKGLDYAGELLDLLLREKDLSARPLFLHAMSVGGYVFAQMLVKSIDGNPEKRAALDKIRGQVFDSLVIGSLEKMAKGVASMVSSSLLKPLVARGSLLYFNLLKAQTLDYYEQGIRAFTDHPIPCPALFFYCMDDALSDHIAVEQLIENWNNRGIRTQGKKWVNSIHAGHLRKHPDEYTETLSSFMQGLHPNSPKCKL